MADVAQLVRALVCGTRCREFESLHPPHIKKARRTASFFNSKNCLYLVRCFNKICAGYTDWYNNKNSKSWYGDAFCSDKKCIVAATIADFQKACGNCTDKQGSCIVSLRF